MAILMPPSPETLIAHIATYKTGAILVPMIHLFGPLAIEYRLKNSQAKGVVTDKANLHKILEIKDRLPDLELIIVARWRGRRRSAGLLEDIGTGKPVFFTSIDKIRRSGIDHLYFGNNRPAQRGSSRPPTDDI